MTAVLPRRDEDHSSLLPYKFGTCADFDILVKNNHFLFRVYTPRERSPFFDDTDPFFIAPKFDERYNRSPLELSHNDYRGTYDDVVKHMDWTSRHSSSFISTSFSFTWSIWEALRRYYIGMKKDIHIAVIDASAVSGRAVMATELLRKGDPSERKNKYWKWYRFSQESQSVLVYELIPSTAVLASIPLPSLLEKLPSYFLQLEIPHPLQDNSLAAVTWNYAERKQTYRQFCRNMSTRFLQLSPEARLLDTTTGSVRLALAFLRPWFHKCVVDDFQMATVTLCALAFSIAQWPGQWWAQEHLEIYELIRAMVLSVAEEIRVKQQSIAVVELTRLQDMITEIKEAREVEGRLAAANANRLQGEITELEVVVKMEQRYLSAETDRLRGTISELEEAVKKYESELSSRDTKKPAHHLTPLIIPPPLGQPSVTTSHPFMLAPPSSLSSSNPRKIPTPITPPTSPIHSTAPTFPIETFNVPASSPTEICDLPTPIESVPPSPTIQSPPSPVQSSLADEEELLITFPSAREELNISPLLSTPLLSTPPALPSNKVSPESSLLVEPPMPTEAKSPLPVLEPLHLELDDIFIPDHVPSVPFHPSTRQIRKSSTLAETASCLVTGFLFGAFITLCLLSPQRRTLLTNIT